MVNHGHSREESYAGGPLKRKSSHLPEGWPELNPRLTGECRSFNVTKCFAKIPYGADA